MLKYKLWYYQTAVDEGSEESVSAGAAAAMPDWVKAEYDIAHSKFARIDS